MNIVQIKIGMGWGLSIFSSQEISPILWNALPIEIQVETLVYARIAAPSRIYLKEMKDKMKSLALISKISWREMKEDIPKYMCVESDYDVSLGGANDIDYRYSTIVTNKKNKSITCEPYNPRLFEYTPVVFYPSTKSICRALENRGISLVSITAEDIMYHIRLYRNDVVYVAYLSFICDSLGYRLQLGPIMSNVNDLEEIIWIELTKRV